MAKMEVLHLTPTERGELQSYLRKRNSAEDWGYVSIAQGGRLKHPSSKTIFKASARLVKIFMRRDCSI